MNRQGHCRLLAAILIVVCGMLSGCTGPNDEHLDGTYGRRGGAIGRDSVNGTAVLSEMFRNAGHRIITKSELTPSVDDADVLVWIPDNFDPPSPEAIQWLEDWLLRTDGGILIYVGRDFDAAIPYWDAVIPTATGTQAQEMTSRRQEDLADFFSERSTFRDETESRWFSYDPAPPRRKIRELSGPWAEGIDASQIGIELYGDFTPGEFDHDGQETLLATGDDPIITRFEFGHEELESYWEDEDFDYDYYDEYYDFAEWEPSELLLVTNGSFLLNASLVNHEHRKLARKLVDECVGKETVVFLQSGHTGIPIKDFDPPPDVPSSLMIFTVWPLNIILVHMAIVGVVFCFARWPIFGHPHRSPADRMSDFGHHVSALGSMLSRTENRSYVRHQISVYRQAYRSEAGGNDTDETPPTAG